MNTKKPLWRHPEGAKYNLLVIAYVLTGQLLGFWAIVQSVWWLNIGGIALLTSTLIIAGYFIHELAHSLVFKSQESSRRVGEVFSWICGSSYANYERIRKMHLRHHGDRADISCFDHEKFIRTAPRLVKRTIYALEWLHIPAVELVMHYQVIVRNFTNTSLHNERFRTVFTFATRWGLFYGLFLLNPWAPMFYMIAYCLFLKALFIGDAFAHTYEAFVVDQPQEPIPKNGRNAEYDRLNTYSNLVSRRFPWLNLYNLNFGYHNAHHDKPATPWYRLPQMQKELYEDDSPQYMPYREIMRTLHKNRLKCILIEDLDNSVGEGPGRADNFLGAHGVSFLSIV